MVHLPLQPCDPSRFSSHHDVYGCKATDRERQREKERWSRPHALVAEIVSPALVPLPAALACAPPYMTAESDGTTTEGTPKDQASITAAAAVSATETTPLLSSHNPAHHTPTSRPSSLRSVQLHNIAQRHRSHSPARTASSRSFIITTRSRTTSSRSNTAAQSADTAHHTLAHTQPRPSSSTPKPISTGRRLRAKLLFGLISILLAVSVYASFVDDFMGDVEAAISCGTCIGLLLPLKALANVGDDAFVNFFVGWCTKLGVSSSKKHIPPLSQR